MGNFFGYDSVEELNIDRHKDDIEERLKVLKVVDEVIKMLNEAEYLYNRLECNYPSIYESNTASLNILGGWKVRILFEIDQRRDWISQLNKEKHHD